MPDKFNKDFYAAVVALVPLLYITLFLQGQMIQDLAKKIGAAMGKQPANYRETLAAVRHEKFELKHLRVLLKGFSIVVFGPSAFIYVALASTLAGPVATGYSLYALFFGKDVSYMRNITLIATMGLLLLVSASPLLVVVRNFWIPVFHGIKKMRKPDTEGRENK